MKAIRKSVGYCALGLLLVWGGGPAAAVHAQGRNGSGDTARLLRSVRQNALSAAENASAYQWKRVNREVDRVAADTPKLVALFMPADTKRRAEVQQAIQDLRMGRLLRDPVRIGAAAQRLASLCNVLLAASEPQS